MAERASDEDRARLAQMAAALKLVETDEPASGAQLAKAIARANDWRRRHGLPDLVDDGSFPADRSAGVREPSDSADAAGEILERLGARWAIIGGLAALRYRSTSRLTVDADILTEWRPDLVKAFEDAGYVVTATADPAQPPHLLHVRGQGDLIDLLLASLDFQQVALDRAVDHLITVEDLIVFKLTAWRPRDRQDISSILDSEPQLDEAYIGHWVSTWDVLDRWVEARTG
ncbi:MAG TPA: hypothetical protein VK277_13040 [Acidimicrobiales bacterium]|nr:hypothetical protein [Acidimicrobiales bacterium]